jgi:hypothetical protein
MQFIYVQGQVKNWRLAYGETISPCTCLTGIRITPPIYVKAVIHVVEFPAMISSLLGKTTTGEFHIFTDKLMSDTLLPFAKTNFNMMSARKQRSLYQGLHGVAPSCWCIFLSAKSKKREATERKAVNLIEHHFGTFLGRPLVLLEELKLLFVQVCEVTDVPFEGVHALNRSTKREVLEWIGENWDALGKHLQLSLRINEP